MTALTAVLSPDWPADGVADEVVLFLHGFGSNERDLPALAPWLPDGLAWASLRAPVEMGYGAAAWFPLALPDEPVLSDTLAAVDALWAWVDAHVAADARIVPVGFSQGGCMALQLLRTRPERVAAAVALAGFVTAGDMPLDPTLREARPPVFYGRGDIDPVIWPEAVERTDGWVRAHTGATVRVYGGLGHSVREDQLDDMRAFLATAVSRTGER
jgi:phospholipase/carboxylesterase